MTTVCAAGDDALALFDILQLFPRPDECTNSAAREAVDEALEALAALATLLQTLGKHREKEGEGEEWGLLQHLTADIPMLISLAVLLQVVVMDERGFTDDEEEEEEEEEALRMKERRKQRCVPEMLSLSAADYRRTCLTGFSRAEECATLVGQRVLDVLPPGSVVARWLERELGVE
jgi:hypothetical protein